MNHGQRTAQGQRAMQVQSDIFLGWTSIAGRDYLVRQLRDHKAGIENEDLEGNGLVQYARVCGELLSKGHARSGDSCAISGYLGNSDKFDKAMVKFGVAYADQSTKDYDEFTRAIRVGKVPASACRRLPSETKIAEERRPSWRILECLGRARAKVGHAHPNHGMRTKRCWRWLALVLRRSGRRNLRPHAIDLVVQGRNSNVVSQKFLPPRDECIVRPRIIREGATAIDRARQGDGGLPIVRIEPPVIEDDVGGAGRRIDRQPLEELIGAVVGGIRVHAHRLAPRLASIVRGRAVTRRCRRRDNRSR